MANRVCFDASESMHHHVGSRAKVEQVLFQIIGHVAAALYLAVALWKTLRSTGSPERRGIRVDDDQEEEGVHLEEGGVGMSYGSGATSPRLLPSFEPDDVNFMR